MIAAGERTASAAARSVPAATTSDVNAATIAHRL